jgi:hypothetical protein
MNASSRLCSECRRERLIRFHKGLEFARTRCSVNVDNDQSVACGDIVLSTIFSAISLFLALWFTQ